MTERGGGDKEEEGEREGVGSGGRGQGGLESPGAGPCRSSRVPGTGFRTSLGSGQMEREDRVPAPAQPRRPLLRPPPGAGRTRAGRGQTVPLRLRSPPREGKHGEKRDKAPQMQRGKGECSLSGFIWISLP